MEQEYIYMMVTRDKYELPMAVADSAWRLAQICNVNVRTVRHGIESRQRGGWSKYVRVRTREKED